MVPAYSLFLILGAASALFVGMIDPIIAVYYVRVVGLGPLQLVLLGTVVEVAGLLFEVPTGIVADLYSRRLSVTIGVLAVGACFLIQGLFPFLVAIVAAEVLRGIGGTFTSGALEAWIADEIGEGAAAAAYLRYAQARQLGALAGTVVGVALGAVALALPVAIGGAAMLGWAYSSSLRCPSATLSRFGTMSWAGCAAQPPRFGAAWPPSGNGRCWAR
jgi:DHA3 family tetracycline resistance protein-like MFS transporter